MLSMQKKYPPVKFWMSQDSIHFSQKCCSALPLLGSARPNDIDFPTFIMLFDAIFRGLVAGDMRQFSSNRQN